MKLSNSYKTLPSSFYEFSQPEKFAAPELIKFNRKLADELGIESGDYTDDELANLFSGQQLFEGSEPMALAYAGFQFGHPSPQLGDGRAHLLGELKGYDIQLKGSGRTPFSRRGDGRSALGPVVREYIVSEAMHTLGVPTTRALCAVTTGEQVHRQFGPEPGGVFTRVAASHIRVGTFQYFAFKKDIASIEKLMEYTIERHYPELAELKSPRDRALALVLALTEKQSELIAKWSALGFIHGVMNTDNFSLAGITIDYGPCAFMDEFKFQKVFSSIDQNSRYSFFNQVPIAQWNILRLADCLLPLIDKDEAIAVDLVEKKLTPLFKQFHFKRFEALAKKIGVNDYTSEDEGLIHDFLKYMEKHSLDFTLSFRKLTNLFLGDDDFYPKCDDLTSFIGKWKLRVNSVEHLDAINPLYIPRNHQVEKVINDAYKNDFNLFHKLCEVLEDPFTENSEFEEFAQAPLPAQRVCATYCGT